MVTYYDHVTSPYDVEAFINDLDSHVSVESYYLMCNITLVKKLWSFVVGYL